MEHSIPFSFQMTEARQMVPLASRQGHAFCYSLFGGLFGHLLTPLYFIYEKPGQVGLRDHTLWVHSPDYNHALLLTTVSL